MELIDHAILSREELKQLHREMIQADSAVIAMDSCSELGNGVVDYLSKKSAIKGIGVSSTTFKNNEINNFPRESVRSKDVYIIGTGSNYHGSVNDNLMAMCGMIRACKNGSAKYITVVCSYLPYSRSDKKDQARTPIMAKLICDIFKESGADRLICVDLHAAQIQGMFDGPFDNLYAAKHLLAKIREDYPQLRLVTVGVGPDSDVITEDSQSPSVVVSPDAGGSKRTQDWASDLKAPHTFLTKARDHNAVSKIINHKLVDNINLTNKLVLLVDDMGDTLGTLDSAAKILKEKGADKVIAVVTHGIFSGDAFDYLARDNIDRIYVTNTLPQENNMAKSSKIVVVDLSELVGLAILSCVNGSSMSLLFNKG
jgi:ribose-phosphate pyrophosphokinase